MGSKSEVANQKEAPDQTDAQAQRMYEDFCEFIDEFKGESDRAAVILGASKLDQLLGVILERFLLPCPSNQDQLFSNNGSLGTFSSKIDMTYRLGLIDAELCRAIHLIRKIRNSFAHEIYGAKLANGAHKDRVKSLVLPMKDNNSFKWLRESFFDNVEDVRADFSTALGLLVARLDGLIDRLETINIDQIQHFPASEKSE